MLEPRLYILMRTDMDSMNPGKAMAQASHATSCFHKSYQDAAGPEYDDWFGCTEQGFGTTIVLEVDSLTELEDCIEQARNEGCPCDIIFDPTYPVCDGDVIHAVPVNTCGYVFVPNPEFLPSLLARRHLHP